MGLIRAALGTVNGALADQWLETIEPEKIDNTIIATYGVTVNNRRNARGSNRKGTEDVISNGSIIHVPENVFMLLVDGGKIISATDEAGYYQVDNSRAPSIFFQSDEDVVLPGYNNTGRNAIQRPGGIINTLKDSWERFKFGGTTPLKQRVIYINKQELPGIRFGTKNPVPYTDRVLVPGRPVPCKVTSFGTYSIKVSDPMLFYSEVCNKTDNVNFAVEDMAEQYLNEFLMAYTTALASLSLDNVMVSDIPIKTMELGQYMADVLDKEWLNKRGFYIHSVGIGGISFDEQTNKLLDRYANDSILLDPNVRAARMTSGMAAGLEAAGSNEGGAMMGFAGMSMGMNAAQATGTMPYQQQQAPAPQNTAPAAGVVAATGAGWACSACGNRMPQDSKFCSACGASKPVEQSNNWKCSCGNDNAGGKFCSNCGKKRPENIQCKKCGKEYNTPPKFCSECGEPF